MSHTTHVKKVLIESNLLTCVPLMTTYSKTYMTNRAIYIEYGKLADNQLQSKHMNERITPVTSEYLEIVIRKKTKNIFIKI